MATGRSRHLAPWLALASLSTIGCAHQGPFSSGRTMTGSLKASVSQLEFENENLKKEIGELKADNSRLDNQLVQEREANGEIAARLDDAKDLIRRQGGNAQALSAPPKNFEDDGVPPARRGPPEPEDQGPPQAPRRPNPPPRARELARGPGHPPDLSPAHRPRTARPRRRRPLAPRRPGPPLPGQAMTARSSSSAPTPGFRFPADLRSR